jgi:hypothetical protein
MLDVSIIYVHSKKTSCLAKNIKVEQNGILIYFSKKI